MKRVRRSVFYVKKTLSSFKGKVILYNIALIHPIGLGFNIIKIQYRSGTEMIRDENSAAVSI